MTELTTGLSASNGYQSRRASLAPHANGKASYAELHKIADHFIGGNRLEKAPESKVKDFVAANDGHTVITNVSIPPPFHVQEFSEDSCSLEKKKTRVATMNNVVGYSVSCVRTVL